MREGTALEFAPETRRRWEWSPEDIRRFGHLVVDLIAQHLGIDRRRALVLAIDELGRTVGHQVARERRALERRDDLGAIGAAGALDRVGDQEHARIVHEHLVGVELTLVLDLLLERECLGIAWMNQ